MACWSILIFIVFVFFIDIVHVQAGRVLISGTNVVSSFKPSLSNKLFKRSHEVSSMKELNSLLDGHLRRGKGQQQISNMITKTPPTVLLRFTAKWCKPCQNIASRYAELARSSRFGSTAFVTVDIDRAMDVAAQYKVRSVPTFVLLGGADGGKKELSRITGGDLEQLEMTLKKYN